MLADTGAQDGAAVRSSCSRTQPRAMSRWARSHTKEKVTLQAQGHICVLSSTTLKEIPSPGSQFCCAEFGWTGAGETQRVSAQGPNHQLDARARGCLPCIPSGRLAPAPRLGCPEGSPTANESACSLYTPRLSSVFYMKVSTPRDPLFLLSDVLLTRPPIFLSLGPS